MTRLLAVFSALVAAVAAPAQPSNSWDAAYLSANPSFRQEPNRFLVEVAAELEPGAALDVGMGQGRNALHLARKGWRVTGFDVSPAGVEQARAAAKAEGLELTALVEGSAEFDWGEERWDLIVVAYFPFLRQSIEPLLRSLRPGGSIVVEAYHADAALDRPPGPSPGVTFDDNELLELFSGLRVIEYQDRRGIADWDLFKTRLVRLHARKD